MAPPRFEPVKEWLPYLITGPGVSRGCPALCRRAATSIDGSGWVCYTHHYLLCDYAIYLMYVGLGYLATICLRYVLFFLVLRKSLRWSFTGESTTTIYSRFTSLVRYDSTLLVYRDSLIVVARLQDTHC